jgi:polar amino acid transport system permease protein
MSLRDVEPLGRPLPEPAAPSRPSCPAVGRLALIGLAVAAGVALCSAAVLRSVWTAVGAGRPGWLLPLLVAVGLVSLLPLWPAVSALRAHTRVRGALAAGELVEARRTAAAGREDAWTAMGYALATLIVAAGVAFATANDAAVARTFLRPEVLADSLGQVADAFLINVQVAVGAEVLVLVVGLLVAVMRMLPGRAGRPLRALAVAYVDVFRAIPGIIVIYVVGFGLSLAEVPVFRDMSSVMLAILALTLTYGAYVGEVYRAGIESIHPSQWAAARSLGLSYGATLRRVIIPQAVRRIVPPLLNDFIGLQKDTALIGVMGVVDAFLQSRLITARVFNLTPVVVVAILFVLITIPQARFVDRLIRRDQQRQRSGGV